jgi:prolyl oligopeptidase
MNRISILMIGMVAVACSTSPKPKGISNYPVTKKVDTVDVYFGTPVADPYRWLEDDQSAETAQWVTAQNEVTFGYLKHIPFRDAVRQRLGEIQNYERISAPVKHGDYFYYSKNSGLQNQSVQYRRKGESGAEEIFIDPNTFSKDGTTSLAGMYFSKDGSLLTILIQEGGSDWRKAVTLRAVDKTMIGDTLRDLKFTGIAWRGNEGFYYSRYENPGGNQLFSVVNYNKVYFHKLNTPQSADAMVYDGGAQNPKRRGGVGLSEDERFLILSTSISTSGNELYIQDLTDPKSKLVPVVANFDNTHSLIDNDGTRLIIRTNLNAPNSRIVEVDFKNPGMENWKDIIPEAEEPIQSVNTAGRKIFVNYLKDAKTQIRQFDNKGNFEREIELPSIGSAGGLGGRWEDSDVYYSFTSFTYPPTIFKYNISTGRSTEYARPKVQFNPDEFETKQVFYTSKDGTRVPMFIVHKKGLALNGKNPTWLYAYGGFNISQTPNFSTSRIVWLENGGVFAMPNLRGGGEYGKKWHDAGTKMKNQRKIYK